MTNERIAALIAQMTLEEKAAQLAGVDIKWIVDKSMRFCPEKAGQHLKHGVGHISGAGHTPDLPPEQVAGLVIQIQKWLTDHTRLGIPAIFHAECLGGLAAKCAPVFPHAIGLGSMWEPELVRRMTGTIRLLMRSMGLHQALSPVMDITFDPRWGRNEETYGEDAYLVAENACAFVEGLQGEDLKHGIAATAKHFAGHAMSEGGRNCSPVRIGPRELRDSVLFPFEAAVRSAGIESVMNAYHDIDGVPCGASKELLTDILRGEWGFDGTVVSDYGTVERLISQHAVAGSKRDAARQALEAGLDVELPSVDCFGEPLIAAVREGLIAEELINRALERALGAKLRLGLLDGGALPSGDPRPLYDNRESAELAGTLARKSLVLLKNEGGLLPLNRGGIRRIAVIGPQAASRRNLLGSYSHASLNGNRFKQANIEDIVEELSGRSIPTLLEQISMRLGTGTDIRYAEGCPLFGEPSPASIALAVEAAKDADVAVVAVGDRSAMFEGGTAGENIDRVSTGLFGAQGELVRAVAETGTPVVLVLVNGRPLTLKEPVERARAVLEAWLPGETGADAIAAALFGEYNPGGKLPVTLLSEPGQHPMPYNMKKVNRHKQYLDSEMRPLLPFGHGLSYTVFTYSNLTVSPGTLSGPGEIVVTFDIANDGTVSGEEVAQLYAHDEVASLARPAMELKGFIRVALEAGETKRIEFRLHTDQLAFHNTAMQLAVEPGRFEVMIGSSSEDIRLRGGFDIAGQGWPVDRVNRVYLSKSRSSAN